MAGCFNSSSPKQSLKKRVQELEYENGRLTTSLTDQQSIVVLQNELIQKLKHHETSYLDKCSRLDKEKVELLKRNSKLTKDIEVLSQILNSLEIKLKEIVKEKVKVNL